jgi:hypothetical protein
MALPQSLASLDVSQRQYEKDKRENNHQKIEHGKTPSPDRRPARWKVAVYGRNVLGRCSRRAKTLREMSNERVSESWRISKTEQ